MATFDVTNIGGPIIGSRSRVNDETRKFGTFNTTHSQLLLDRIVDGDPESFWHDEGDGDGVPSVIDLSVQFRTALISKQVDVVALQNINWKRFKVESSNAGIGGPFSIIPGLDFTGSDNTDTDILLNPTLFTANFFRITINTTFDTDDSKQLGGFYTSLGIVQPGGLLANPRADREMVRVNTLGNGGK
ncbi:MAG: hypothetical protein V3T23_04020, partial [Nitrososphaerales archaeon]